MDASPKYLYKVISLEAWKRSQGREFIQLSDHDRDFIHLSTDQQLDGIINKYWVNIPEFVVLKIDPDNLPGRLVYETNPGGTNKYYHLYNGSIPFESVVDTRMVK